MVNRSRFLNRLPPFRLRFVALPDPSHLSPNEERARIYAVKGYRQARDGQYDRARDTFAHAVSLDPMLDLTSVPNFWQLPRGAHDAAVQALELVDRKRDAARLSAIINRRFRPTLVANRARKLDD